MRKTVNAQLLTVFSVTPKSGVKLSKVGCATTNTNIKNYRELN